MRPVLLLPLLLLLAAAPRPASADGDAPAPAPVTLQRYVTNERSFQANAWWLESPRGLVLIDALFLGPDAENLAALLKSRRKPLLGILVTHPHVDHFGGLATLRRRFPGVPVYASEATAREIPRTNARAHAEGWIQAYGRDYDADIVVPDHPLASGSVITLGDQHFTVTSFGAMESSDNAVIYSHELDAVFTGDAVMNGPIYFVGDGHSAGAEAGLARIAETYPAHLRAYPGHGEPGRLGPMLAHDLAQVRYLRERYAAARAWPNALRPDGRLADAARERLWGMFGEHFRNAPSYGLSPDVIAAMNIEGLEREQAATAP